MHMWSARQRVTFTVNIKPLRSQNSKAPRPAASSLSLFLAASGPQRKYTWSWELVIALHCWQLQNSTDSMFAYATAKLHAANWSALHAA